MDGGRALLRIKVRLMKVLSYFPMPHVESGPSYTALSIAGEYARIDPQHEFFTGWSSAAWPEHLHGKSASRLPLPYRIVKQSPLMALARRRIERHIIARIGQLASPVILHLWPGADVPFIRAAKAKGAIIAREMINTHEGYAKRVLDAESARLGLSPQHGITAASVEKEQAVLAECDLILSPSAIVDVSLAEYGFEGVRVAPVTFGWDPQRFAAPAGAARSQRPDEGRLNALFVGSIGVRKGIHLALEAWRAAAVPGRFVLLGRVEPDFRPILDAHLEPGRVEHFDFVPDPAAFFEAADVFLFPTLEEGAPLVCYEACGSGLPLITSLAGTARLIEDGVNGYLVEPHDGPGLAAAIRRMADAPSRQRMGEAAKARADEFTWRHAAQQRHDCFATAAQAFEAAH